MHIYAFWCFFIAPTVWKILQVLKRNIIYDSCFFYVDIYKAHMMYQAVCEKGYNESSKKWNLKKINLTVPRWDM